MADDFLPSRPFEGDWPVLNPESTLSRIITGVPERSIEDRHIIHVSATKVEGLGIKVYRSTDQTIAHDTEDDIDFDTVSFVKGFTEPTGATFTTVSIPRDAVYDISAIIEYKNAATAGDYAVWLYINGAKLEGSSSRSTDIVPRRNVAVSRLMSAGDTIGLRVKHVLGASASKDVLGGEDNCALTVMYRFEV